MKPKLNLKGVNGNAFALLSKARTAALDSGFYTKDDWDKVEEEAMIGDYKHLLQVMTKYFEVDI